MQGAKQTHMHAFDLIVDRFQLLLLGIEFGHAAFEQPRGAIVPH